MVRVMVANRRSIALIVLGVIGILCALSTLGRALTRESPEIWIAVVGFAFCGVACIVRGTREYRRRT